jgi:endonuclease-3
MKKEEKIAALSSYLHELYPLTKVFLNGEEDYQFLIAVILSAQAQDKVVNQVTPVLFSRYRSLEELSKAEENDVLSIIRRVGLGPSKAHNIVSLAKELTSHYDCQLPNAREDLEKLPGVGHKTAGVFLGERKGGKYIPVDTHIKRICTRLGICREEDSADEVEKILERFYLKDDKMNFHREMILFGRNICLANGKRHCEKCPLAFCKDRKKE